MTGPVKALRHWLKRQRDTAFLSNLAAPAWSDLGASRDDLLQIASGPSGIGKRMQAMAAAYGIDQPALSEERWRQVDMARACAHCNAQRQCKSWLKGPDQDAATARFCPNRAHFAELSGTDVQSLDAKAKNASCDEDQRLHYL